MNDIIVTLIIGAGVAILIAMGLAKLSSWLTTKTLQKRFKKVMDGKSSNKIKLSGQEINLDTWIVEEKDGTTKKVRLGKIKISTKENQENQYSPDPAK